MFELNKIYNCDALEFMKQVPDKYFDLVLTDPPYLIGESGQTNKSRSCLAKSKDYGNKNWDSKELDPLIFEHIFRISTFASFPQRLILLIFVGKRQMLKQMRLLK